MQREEERAELIFQEFVRATDRSIFFVEFHGCKCAEEILRFKRKIVLIFLPAWSSPPISLTRARSPINS
jgi:hypothetical protein